MLSFYGMHVVYFPVLVISLRGITHWQNESTWQWPGWAQTGALLAIAIGLYLLIGYGVTRALAQAEAAKLEGSR